MRVIAQATSNGKDRIAGKWSPPPRPSQAKQRGDGSPGCRANGAVVVAPRQRRRGFHRGAKDELREGVFESDHGYGENDATHRNRGLSSNRPPSPLDHSPLWARVLTIMVTVSREAGTESRRRERRLFVSLGYRSPERMSIVRVIYESQKSACGRLMLC